MYSNSSKEDQAKTIQQQTTTQPMDDEQLEKLLLGIKSKSDEEIVNEENSTGVETHINDDSQVPRKSEINDKGDNSLPGMDEKTVESKVKQEVDKGDKGEEKQTIKEEIMEIKQEDENDIIKITTDQSKMNETLETDQSNVSVNINDQSETETETADEQIDYEITEEESMEVSENLTKFDEKAKVKTEELDYNEVGEKKDVYKPFSSLEGLPTLPAVDGLSQSEIVARFELLVEVERIEREVEKRMKELNAQLDGMYLFQS